MKELDALMKKLEETGKIKALKMTMAIVPLPKNLKTEEEKQALINEAIKHCFDESILDHEEIMDLFANFAHELALEAIIKELNIKPTKKKDRIPKFLEFLDSIKKEIEAEE